MQGRPPSGRARRVIIGVAVFLVVTGGIIAAYEIHRYAPLYQGSTFHGPAGAVLVSDSPFGSPVYRLDYHHGEETGFGFTIFNGGRWAVTIVDLTILHQTAHALLMVTGATVGDPARPDIPSTPFKPFTLRSGEERLITLQGRFADCEWYTAGGGNAFEVMQVRYRFWWSTREASIPLASRVEVISPPDAGCPVSRTTTGVTPSTTPSIAPARSPSQTP